MLLEMQSAMNNMMNNNHLQSQLHGSQTLAIAPPLPPSTAEPTSEGSGPASSPSASPHSSQSDSSSDPEPSVSMDTGSSSASPSASDSSEEEVIGSVTRAHQETFMYNQEQSSLSEQKPASLSSGFTEPDAHFLMEGQESWNRHNNLVSETVHNPSSILNPQDLEDNTPTQCPFRLSRTASASHCPTYIHGAFRAGAARAASGPGWRGGNRMHLVR